MADLSFGPRFVVPSEHVGAPVGKPAGERSATSDAASPGLLSVATTSAGARPDSSHLSARAATTHETNRRGRRIGALAGLGRGELANLPQGPNLGRGPSQQDM